METATGTAAEGGMRSIALRPFGSTIFAEITALANAKDAVNLGQGFPDSDGPDVAKSSAAAALRDHHNQYAPLGGVPALQAAIAGRAGFGRSIDPTAEVTVTAGCTEALAAVMLGLLNPGDEVVLFEPFYDSYRACVAMAGARARFVPLRRDGGRYGFDRDDLRAAVTDRTRAILVNSPHNPTGAVFGPGELEAVAEFCRSRDLIAVSDEVYEALVYEGEHASIASLPGMADRTIVCSSFGKTFAMTGWKVGWAIAPPGLTAAVRAAHQFLVFSVPTPLQHAAAATLASEEAWAWAAEQRERYRAHRDALVEGLRGLGFGVAPPPAGYFVMASYDGVAPLAGLGDTDACLKLIDEAGVATIPPSAFYASSREAQRTFGPPSLRFAFCKRRETLDDALARLGRWLGSV